MSGGEGRRSGPPRFFVYDASFKSEHEEAPALDPTLIAKLGHDDSADMSAERSLDVLVRLPWKSSRCAYLLAREPLPRHATSHWSDALSEVPVPAALVLATMIALWLLLSGVVRRLHTLAADVTRVLKSAHKERVSDLGQDEIGMVASAFNSASDSMRKHIETLEEREQQLREFLANTTHDIMIPLTVLQGLLSKASASEPVLAAREEAYYIGSLLSNLSAVAKLEAGTTQFHRGETKLDNIVERATERYRGIANERGVSLEMALPGTQVVVNADPTLVEQCVSNLVYNAVRYNKRGGYVTVVLDVSKDRFVLRVVDDGPGMSDEERARALDRGFRSQRARRENPDGLGLGLSIVRAVIALHAWSLTLARSEDGGLEAKIEGPLSPQ
jgi:signal transduction histidine kinase